MGKTAEVTGMQWNWLESLGELTFESYFKKITSISVKTWNMDPFLPVAFPGNGP